MKKLALFEKVDMSYNEMDKLFNDIADTVQQACPDAERHDTNVSSTKKYAQFKVADTFIANILQDGYSLCANGIPAGMPNTKEIKIKNVEDYGADEIIQRFKVEVLPSIVEKYNSVKNS